MSRRHLTSADVLPPQGAGVLRIYNMRYCPYAQRALLVLHHKGIQHEVVNINLKDKPAWFFERNPNGTVPIYEKDDKVLYESMVIMDYLDEVYPEHKLTPDDPFIKAKGRIIVEHFSKVIGVYYKLMLGGDEDRKNNCQAFLAAIDKFEQYLPDTKFLCGDEVSMADYSVWPWVERFRPMNDMYNTDIINEKRCPKLHAWVEAMLETPGVKGTILDAGEMRTFLLGYQIKQAEYDFAL